MSEKEIEQKSVKVAKEHGWITFKFSSPSHRGVPDRIFIGYGRVVFVEFKTRSGKLTSLQRNVIAEMRKGGAEVYISRSVEDTKRILIITG